MIKMKLFKTWHVLVLVAFGGCVLSCSTPKFINVAGVGYQSLQQKPSTTKIDPLKSEIAVFLEISPEGEVAAYVMNNTDEVMIIDRTKSFFRNINDLSKYYYTPPTSEMVSSTTAQSSSSGIGVNLGGFFGGPLGSALSGVNVGTSSGEGSSTTTTKVIETVDQPQIILPAHSKAYMGKSFSMDGVGTEFLNSAVKQGTNVSVFYTPDQTYSTGTVMIYYRIGENGTEKHIDTTIFANSLLISKVWQKGKVNDALRSMYANQPSLLAQPWYILYFASDCPQNNFKAQTTTFINYK